MSASQHEIAISKLLKEVGEDPTREGLLKTPKRFVESFAELTSGYKFNLDDMAEGALFSDAYDDMVVVRNIEFYSLCEHHLLPFFGRCHVGYIPTDKIIGLSKIPRIVEMYARRLQVQERMTNQIAEGLMQILAPQGLGIVMEASHLCMMMRGVQKQNSYAITSAMKGCFLKPETRNEFMAHVHAKPFHS